MNPEQGLEAMALRREDRSQGPGSNLLHDQSSPLRLLETRHKLTIIEFDAPRMPNMILAIDRVQSITLPA